MLRANVRKQAWLSQVDRGVNAGLQIVLLNEEDVPGAKFVSSEVS